MTRREAGAPDGQKALTGAFRDASRDVRKNRKGEPRKPSSRAPRASLTASRETGACGDHISLGARPNAEAGQSVNGWPPSADGQNPAHHDQRTLKGTRTSGEADRR